MEGKDKENIEEELDERDVRAIMGPIFPASSRKINVKHGVAILALWDGWGPQFKREAFLLLRQLIEDASDLDRFPRIHLTTNISYPGA